MKKILKLLLTTGLILFISVGCSNNEIKEKDAHKDRNDGTTNVDEGMQIQVQGENTEPIIFKLNDSSAAKSLYDQLPMTIEVENYSDNEKFFYPPNKLDVSNTPMAKGPAGTLAYYEPWDDVVMYYGDCGGASGLYALGEVITNRDLIEELSGTITISKFQMNDEKIEKTEETIDSIDQDTNLRSSIQSDTSWKEEDGMFHIQIKIGDQIFTASLYDNSTVRALMKQLPLTLDMGELHGNEKFYYFPSALPTEAQRVSQIYTGDLKLFDRDCLVLFYKDFQTSYSYTSLGQIDHVQGLAEALGNGNIQIHIYESFKGHK